MNILKENSHLETDIAYHFYSYGLNEVYNSYYVLNNDGFKQSNVDIRNGYRNYTSVSSLNSLYEFIGTLKYEELTDKLGQYCFYNKYDDSEVFVFYNYYNNYAEQNVLNIVINKNGKTTILKDTIEPGKCYFPEFTYKEKDNYYILSVEEMDKNPNIKIYKIDISDMQMKMYTFKLPEGYSNGAIIDILVENEKVYICFDKNNNICIYDTITQTAYKEDIENINTEFFIRDQNNIYYGFLDNNILNVQRLSFELETEAKFKIPIDIDHINLSYGSPFCKNNKLYLELKETNYDLQSFKNYSCIIDMKTLNTINLYEYSGEFDGNNVRYLKKNNMEYIDEAYQSSR